MYKGYYCRKKNYQFLFTMEQDIPCPKVVILFSIINRNGLLANTATELISSLVGIVHIYNMLWPLCYHSNILLPPKIFFSDSSQVSN